MQPRETDTRGRRGRRLTHKAITFKSSKKKETNGRNNNNKESKKLLGDVGLVVLVTGDTKRGDGLLKRSRFPSEMCCRGCAFVSTNFSLLFGSVRPAEKWIHTHATSRFHRASSTQSSSFTFVSHCNQPVSLSLLCMCVHAVFKRRPFINSSRLSSLKPARPGPCWWSLHFPHRRLLRPPTACPDDDDD